MIGMKYAVFKKKPLQLIWLSNRPISPLEKSITFNFDSKSARKTEKLNHITFF